MAISLKYDISKIFSDIENLFDNPTFVWNGTNYPCMASVNEFERELELGGFRKVKQVTLVVRLNNNRKQLTFVNNTYPSPQDLITYNNISFRIVRVKKDPLSAYVEIIGESDTRGI